MNLSSYRLFFQKFMQLPFKIKIRRGFSFLRGMRIVLFLDEKGFVEAGKRIKISKENGIIHLNTYCRIGDDATIVLRGASKESKAELRIGSNTAISNRTIINVTKLISIGDHCSISWDCDIRDTCWHRVRLLEGVTRPIQMPVIIENNVWVGSNVIIERGVRIGENSVIAAGSRVIRDIPPNSLAAGNPAKVIKKIAGWVRDIEDSPQRLESEITEQRAVN